MDIVPQEGKATTSVYLVVYDEDLWCSFDEERQQYCKEHWIKKAEPFTSIEEVVLKLVPDELLPRGDKERPYIAWRHKFQRGPKDEFEVLPATVQIKSLKRELTPSNRSKINVLMQTKYPKGTKFHVFYSMGMKAAITLWEDVVK